MNAKGNGRQIGVYICHCGTNIAGTVDVKDVALEAGKIKDVVVARDYKYMCSNPGQDLIKNDIKEKNLDAIVVAACSPKMHESTYRKVLQESGLNPFLFEMANIREQCSWVHRDKEKATEKAIDLVKMAIVKVRQNEALEKIKAEVVQRILVIGGGIAGIQASLDLSDQGYEVVLVEKEQSIGGRMSQLNKTFPTLDCSACILTPKMVEVGQRENIILYSYAEVEEVSGYVGNFEVKIRKKARYVDEIMCNGCGLCEEKCPTKVISEYEEGMGKRKAIYRLFPQAVPNIPVIDADNCLYLTEGKCGVCKKICTADAIDYEQKDEIITEKVGAVIIATGYDTYDAILKEEYGYGIYNNVITGLQLERLIHPAGPTKGELKRPSDQGKIKRIAFVQCVGSRDERANKYCSRVCCMYAIKNAILIKERYPDIEIYIFYIDIRAFGKGYEEFYKRAQEEFGIKFIRGRVAEILEDPDTKNLIIRADDTLLNVIVEAEVDLAVLSVAIIPRKDSENLQKLFGLVTSPDGFLMEAHAKLRPVDTQVDGIFLAGCVQGPKDIPDTVAQAKAAASSALGLISKKTLELEPIVAVVEESLCRGCGDCADTCEFGAIELQRLNARIVAKVNKVLCKGCGACSVACCNGAIVVKNFRDTQTFEMIATALESQMTV